MVAIKAGSRVDSISMTVMTVLLHSTTQSPINLSIRTVSGQSRYGPARRHIGPAAASIVEVKEVINLSIRTVSQNVQSALEHGLCDTIDEYERCNHRI